MTADVPAEVFPVGEHLADELERRGWTQGDLADVLARPAQFVSEVVSGKKEITRESAAQLGAALGTSAEYWLNLQDSYLLWQQAQDGRARTGLDEVRLRARMKDLAPIPLLVSRGYIVSDDVHEQAHELMRLIGIDDIEDDPDLVLAARRSNVQQVLTPVQRGWVAAVRASAKNVEVAAFSESGLVELAGQLSNLASRPSGFEDLPERFAQVGVRLVYVENFPSSRFDGCSTVVDGVLVIGLSGRGHRLDKVLFTLLHEIAHIVLGHLVDDDLIIDELDGSDVSEHERAADAKAAEWILPLPLPSVPLRISADWVNAVSSEQGVAPIVVVGRLQKLDLLNWRTVLGRGAPSVVDQLRRWC